MSRKATFFPKIPHVNSSAHNSRKEIPKYLIEIDPNFDGNYYEKVYPYENDEQFRELCKIIYKQKMIERTGQHQRMQQKQVDALIYEVVITVEKHHRKEDILNLFTMLREEKRMNNLMKMGLLSNLLKPISIPDVYKLPKKLKIKRKPKKENLNEVGYHILELAGHYDEGHFIRKGKWDNLPYYPGRDILFKNGNWYIKSDELNESTEPEIFNKKANMAEFEKVYNDHWHVKYTNFNIETGLTASFSKGEISGEGRLKKVAKFLHLKYVAEEKISIAQSVRSVKEQHHIDRQNKYTQIMMKLDHRTALSQSTKKIEKREALLAKKSTDARFSKRKYSESEENIQQLEKRIEEQQREIEEIRHKLPKKNEVIISEELYEDIQKLLLFFHVTPEQNLFDAVEDVWHNTQKAYDDLRVIYENTKKSESRMQNKTRELENEILNKENQLGELKEKIVALEKFKFSDKNAYRNSKKTGQQLTYKSLYEMEEKQRKILESENALLHEKVNLLTQELEAYIKVSHQKSGNIHIESLLHSKDTDEQTFNDLDESSSP